MLVPVLITIISQLPTQIPNPNETGPCSNEVKVLKLDSKYGFRGYRFGQPLPKNKFSLKYSNKDIKNYIKINENFNIAEISAKSILYLTKNNLLNSVSIYFDSKDFIYILTILEDEFGESMIYRTHNRDNVVGQYLWISEKVVMTLYYFDEITIGTESHPASLSLFIQSRTSWRDGIENTQNSISKGNF